MQKLRMYMQWIFLFFFISGFCSLLYELVWLRLAMAQFGVTTALISIVLSMFMAGLGLGSWISGIITRQYAGNLRIPALRLYAATEFLIGVSALLVPLELHLGRTLLEHFTGATSFAYYLASGTWIALTLIPWCACMGATIPFAMLSIARTGEQDAPRSFSFLYLANVLGATAGALFPLLLIELYGFHGTLRFGAICNLLLAASAFTLSFTHSAKEHSLTQSASSFPLHVYAQSRRPLLVLFFSGLTCMGMEVVWIRLYTPYSGTYVYAFAAILATYLLATFLGSQLYRQWSRKQKPVPASVWVLLALTALLPLLVTSYEINLNVLLRILLGLIPFNCLLGFITPMLVDHWSGGNPDRAGSAYAINVIGCILGPLVSGFGFLPFISERWTLLIFAAPWFLLSLYPQWLLADESLRWSFKVRQIIAVVALIATLFAVARYKDFAEEFTRHETMRDSTATVIAVGQGMQRRLLVNGVGITSLTPITKMMAHMPLAFLNRPPKNALVICFGMGTTFRSMLSWEIPTTVVELVPSVPKLFGYFHPDGPQLLKSPLAHVVIDDGRRYLERTDQKFDVITLDPPPPVEAAGSSLLYSKEFYSTVKQHLRPGGILQTWLPGGDQATRSAVARSLRQSFPYVRVYGSLEHWGNHFLASEQPIPDLTPQQLVARMPATAVADMMEWGPKSTPQEQFTAVLNTRTTLDQLIAEAPDLPPLTDDRPINEYYLLRRADPALLHKSY